MILTVLLVCMVFIVTFFAYLLGSIPFGVVIAKTFCNIDPRSAGSGNVGATNVARLCGKGFGALTLVCDVLKGSLPVYFAVYFLPLLRVLLVNIYLLNVDSYASIDDETFYELMASINFLGIVCSGIAVVAGHMFSFFLDFKGGKGVATSVGVFLVLAPFEFVIAGILCLLVIWRSGYVSAGSLVLVTVLPLLLLADILLPDRMMTLHEFFALPFTNNLYFFILSLVIAVLVIYAHRENIDRLRKGEEKSWIKPSVPK